MKKPYEDVKKGLKFCEKADIECCPKCPYWEIADCNETLSTDAYELITELEERIAIMEEGGWNNVSDGLPEEGREVWIYAKDGGIISGFITNKVWVTTFGTLDSENDYLTHWQYKKLPDPPKEIEAKEEDFT